jgi:hypothetical protein
VAEGFSTSQRLRAVALVALVLENPDDRLHIFIDRNGHFAMFETSRKQVFEVIRGSIEPRLPATGLPVTTARR